MEEMTKMEKRRSLSAQERCRIITEVGASCLEFDTWRNENGMHMGADLAYLFLAVADTENKDDSWVDWSKEAYPDRDRTLETHLMEELGEDHPVWLFIETDAPLQVGDPVRVEATVGLGEFSGTIYGFKDGGPGEGKLIQVLDQDDNVWDIEAGKVRRDDRG